MPCNPDGDPHWGTCPNAEEFRRTRPSAAAGKRRPPRPEQGRLLAPSEEGRLELPGPVVNLHDDDDQGVPSINTDL